VWEHSYNSLDKSSRNWEGEPWAVPGVVPSLVLELALSQLRSLLGEGSPDSLASAEAVEQVALAAELYPDGEEERP